MRDKAQRASRVLLDIEAGAPVLLIPEGSKSNSLIVANLGKLKVKNRFLFAGMPGTFSLKNKVRTLLHYFLINQLMVFLVLLHFISLSKWKIILTFYFIHTLRTTSSETVCALVHWVIWICAG